jgi:hypothetical protein
MSQVYYTIEKMVGGMYTPIRATDIGGDAEEPGEPEFDTEDAAQQAIEKAVSDSGKPRAGKGGKGEQAPRPVRSGSFRIVQKQRLRAGIIGAPSAPGALDPPVVPRMPVEDAKKRIDEQRKEEDERFERSGVLPPRVNPQDLRREVSGSPYATSQHDRVTSTSDIGAKVGMAARGKAKGGGEGEQPASRGQQPASSSKK